jgi:hypothetical protein
MIKAAVLLKKINMSFHIPCNKCTLSDRKIGQMHCVSIRIGFATCLVIKGLILQEGMFLWDSGGFSQFHQRIV